MSTTEEDKTILGLRDAARAWGTEGSPWERLAAGQLTAEEQAALQADAEKSEEGRALFQLYRPFDEGEKQRMFDGVRTLVQSEARRRRRARMGVLTAVAATLATAAAVPLYSLSQRPHVATSGPLGPDDQRIVFDTPDRVRSLTVYPTRLGEAPFALRGAVLVHKGQTVPWAPQVNPTSPDGKIRIVGSRRDLFPCLEAGSWTVVVALGAPGATLTESEMKRLAEGGWAGSYAVRRFEVELRRRPRFRERGDAMPRTVMRFPRAVGTLGFRWRDVTRIERRRATPRPRPLAGAMQVLRYGVLLVLSALRPHVAAGSHLARGGPLEVEYSGCDVVRVPFDEAHPEGIVCELWGTSVFERIRGTREGGALTLWVKAPPGEDPALFVDGEQQPARWTQPFKDAGDVGWRAEAAVPRDAHDLLVQAGDRSFRLPIRTADAAEQSTLREALKARADDDPHAAASLLNRKNSAATRAKVLGQLARIEKTADLFEEAIQRDGVAGLVSEEVGNDLALAYVHVSRRELDRATKVLDDSRERQAPHHVPGGARAGPLFQGARRSVEG